MSINNVQDTPSSWSLRDHPYRRDIRYLFFAALIVFVITVAIGLLNGQHLVKLMSEDVLLTHVHAGTLGWITLNVFAVLLWIFGAGSTARPGGYVRVLSLLATFSIPVYVLAFLSGNAIARAIFGVPVLLAIIGAFGWIIARSRQIRLGVVHLALLGAFVTLIVGSTLGVLLQIQFVTLEQAHTQFLPDGAFGAHPATQTVGYLILIAMALAEWRLMPTMGKLPIAGLIQIILPFLAGFALSAALLLNIQPLFAVNALLEVLGIVIFVVRFLPRVVRISWVARGSARFFVLAALFLVVNVALLVYVVVLIVTGVASDPTANPGALIASDHAIFVGVMTNAFFGLIHDAGAERRTLWPWADHVLFWGMNIGLTGFLVALVMGQQPVLERIFTPIMGLSILLGLLTYGLRLREVRAVPATEAAAIKQDQTMSIP